jgi:hypothetical protein
MEKVRITFWDPNLQQSGAINKELILYTIELNESPKAPSCTPCHGIEQLPIHSRLDFLGGNPNRVEHEEGKPS